MTWKCKGLSDEIMKFSTAPSNNLAAKLKRINNLKIAEEFNVSRMKQDKATITLKNVVNLFICID